MQPIDATRVVLIKTRKYTVSATNAGPTFVGAHKMRDYTVEQTSFNFKWTFKRMLPSLPGPGTPAFAELCKGLADHGLTAQGVTVDSPTSRLGDLYMALGLLDNNRLTIRIACANVEFFVRELYVGDEEALVPIAEMVFASLSSVDKDAIEGRANVKTSSHLKLRDGEIESILREHISSVNTQALIPDAVIYKVNIGSESKALEMRLALARSLVYANALFLDINADYEGPFSAPSLAEEIQKDSERLTQMLGLIEQDAPVNSTTE